MSKSIHYSQIVLLGAGGVGKSCLTTQYVSSKFIEKYDPTIEDMYRKETYVDGKYLPLEIIDTAGTEQFQAMQDMYMKRGDVFLLVYSITNLGTFNEIRKTHQNIHASKDRELGEVPIILCANKADLEDERVVSTEMGRRLAEELNINQFVELSAKTDPGSVTVLFENMIRIQQEKIGVQKKSKKKTLSSKFRNLIKW
eukprot:Awhi_evm1s7812